MEWSLARRENNQKRNFVIVNSDLCKHVPNNPNGIKYGLANKLVAKMILGDETLTKGYDIIVIGFAETATALGYFVAEGLKALLPYTRIEYTTTTRNRVDGEEYAEFTESHSHATEQFILKKDILVDKATKFILVDDEITTGDTAFKLINIIEEVNGKGLGNTYSLVAPTINKQVGEKVGKMLNFWVNVCAITELEDSEYNTFSYWAEHKLLPNEHKETLVMPNCIIDKFWNIELGTDTSRNLSEYKEYLDSYSRRIGNSLWANVNFEGNTLVDIIGCEEYMTLAIMSGMELQNCSKANKLTVLTHSITRSPIEPSDDSLLTTRLMLPSLYGDYKTYIYNSSVYDKSKYKNIIVALVFPVEMNDRNKSILTALTIYFKSKGADKVVAYTYKKVRSGCNEVGKDIL